MLRFWKVSIPVAPSFDLRVDTIHREKAAVDGPAAAAHAEHPVALHRRNRRC
ncbi:MAG: hypothetical protein U0232_03340 [Thermomicrobiales bacterium]